MRTSITYVLDNSQSFLPPVDKVILLKEEMQRFCNDVEFGSFQSETKVDYAKLCKQSLHFIGVYGNPIMIAELLLRNSAISTEV